MRSVRLVVRTSGFHPENWGSTPQQTTVVLTLFFFIRSLAQWFRASALHAEGHRFESYKIYENICEINTNIVMFD